MPSNGSWKLGCSPAAAAVPAALPGMGTCLRVEQLLCCERLQMIMTAVLLP